MSKDTARQFIADSAIRASSAMSITDRAAVLDEVAKILSGPAKEHALATSFALRQSEVHQLKLTQLLKESVK